MFIVIEQKENNMKNIGEFSNLLEAQSFFKERVLKMFSKENKDEIKKFNFDYDKANLVGKNDYNWNIIEINNNNNK